MIIIDTNSLLVLIIGLINPNLFESHRRTSIYDKEDFLNLLFIIGDFQKLVVLPNIWTEVDNLLNESFSRNYKDTYVKIVQNLIGTTTEKYLESKYAMESDYFYQLGLTDSLILEVAKDCDFMITSDSLLSDISKANGIEVFDLISYKNNK